MVLLHPEPTFGVDCHFPGVLVRTLLACNVSLHAERSLTKSFPSTPKSSKYDEIKLKDQLLLLSMNINDKTSTCYTAQGVFLRSEGRCLNKLFLEVYPRLAFLYLYSTRKK